ncbi:MAG: tol-pal system YbgF family protein, partial [Phycisphaerae bacterium]
MSLERRRMAEAGRSVGRHLAPHPARASARAVQQAKRGTDPPDAGDGPEISDVWSRTSAKYRVRAVVLLLINVLLFGGLCTFAFWLRTGKVFAPIDQNYWHILAETFHPSRDTTVSLSALLTFPINIEEVPLQIVILGLLLAALVSIPILVAILYRLPAALPFLALVAFVAMMPWLAITLTGACLIVSVKPFRFQFRYASALMGLLLVLAYFYGAARTASQPVASLDNPADRIKYIAPWLLATVASCLLMGFVLLIARMVNYRPGAIAPLLALMFALPVALFEVHVGRDELHYRIIEHDYGPGSAYFADRDVSQTFDWAVREAFLARPAPRPDINRVKESAELLWSLELDEALGPFNTAVSQHRYNAVQQISWFLRQFPTSRNAVGALYLMARAADMRVDQQAFRHHKALRFYSDFPTDRSRHWWKLVVANGPDTPMAAVALYRLAQLDVRAGDIESARQRLEELVKRF